MTIKYSGKVNIYTNKLLERVIINKNYEHKDQLQQVKISLADCFAYVLKPEVIDKIVLNTTFDIQYLFCHNPLMQTNCFWVL